MIIFGIIGALIGTGIGAAIWGAMLIVTDSEYAIAAIFVGGLIGFLASVFGGKGITMGIICALLTLTSIYIGKCYALTTLAEDFINEEATLMFTRDNYENQYKKAALELDNLHSDDQYPAFMVKHGFYEEADLEYILDEDIEIFKLVDIPLIQMIRDNNMDYETWEREGKPKYISTITAEIPIGESILDGLDFFDFLFALLGIWAAFKLGTGAWKDPHNISTDLV